MEHEYVIGIPCLLKWNQVYHISDAIFKKGKKTIRYYGVRKSTTFGPTS